MNRLQDKVAIVTGTGPLIGGALAAGLAAEGARVVCTGLDEEAVNGCVTGIEKAGGEAYAAIGDVTDAEHARSVVEQAADRWGRVDVLVNSAVWFRKQGLLTMAVEDYRRQLDVILTGAFLFTREAAGHMIRTGTRGASSTCSPPPPGRASRATSATPPARAA